MTSKKIEKIIAKYLINQASFEELDELEVWVKEPNNEQDFLNYVKINFSIDYNLRITDTNKTKDLISTLIKKEKRQIRIRRMQIYTKYAAVMIIALFLTGYFFRDSLFGISSDNQIVPEIVNTNSIYPGTDKATLTLGDGSQIALEKGESLQTQNANSNGEEIIYKANQSNTEEVAYNYLTIPRGGQFFIKLSDGTQVWLNSETQLKYPVSFKEGETRQVELVYGEAYFDVSPSALHKGSKFKVFNQSQEIEVLGTEFNIKAYKDETNVYTTLVEGSVAVAFDGGKENLIPSQQSILDILNSTVMVAKVDVYSQISWKEGVFTFEGKPLKDIVKVLSRWYDVDFVFEDKSSEEKRFNGSLNRKLNINEILDIIKNFEKIKDYEINEKTIVIK